MLLTSSKIIAQAPAVYMLLGKVSHSRRRCLKFSEKSVQATVGWGRKLSALRAEEWAKKIQVPCWHLEDGFLRSYMPGQESVGLSLVVDEKGIYYDATAPSDLEVLLNSEDALLDDIEGQVEHAIVLIKKNRLSKYNHAPDFDSANLRKSYAPNVLVVDQTYGDSSVERGMADENTFKRMVFAALNENPESTIYIKTHPEVSGGVKQGYLTEWPEHPRVVMLRSAVNPLSLLEYMDRVYVVSSTLGFEALLMGKPVSVFGMPWYAGWGVSDDRQYCKRRQRRRSIKELFAAAYFHYTRYLNPETYQPGTIFDVIKWLVRQKEEEAKFDGRIIPIAINSRDASELLPLLSLSRGKVKFVNSVSEAEKLAVSEKDSLVVWGRNDSEPVESFALRTRASLWRVEDGIVSAIGLGGRRLPSMSLVLDKDGIYFDPSRSSTLEEILLKEKFSQEECRRARRIRELIVQHHYRVEPNEPPCWKQVNKEIVFVPGQAKGEGSPCHGASSVRSSLELLQAARAANPGAFIVYRPHPELLLSEIQKEVKSAGQWADYVETSCSVVCCLKHCDVVHTIASLTGFEALLHGKQVVTYGEPFYAGWGLTEDRVEYGEGLHRRKRRLSLDELIAGVLIRYPRYWDPVLKGYTTCEVALSHMLKKQGGEVGLNIANEIGGACQSVRFNNFLSKFQGRANPASAIRSLLQWFRG